MTLDAAGRATVSPRRKKTAGADGGTTAVGGGARIRQAGEARLVGVEAVRGIAALVVVWSHAWEFSRDYTGVTYGQRLLNGGDYAPYLFFVLSGYLLFWPFAQAAWGNRRPISVRNYAVNRAWRILPLYYVILVVVMLLQYHGGSLRDWIAFTTFTQNFSSATLGRVDAPMWSLAVEMQFYLVLPLLAWGMARVSRGSLRLGATALAALVVISFIARQVTRYGTPGADGIQLLSYSVIECFCYLGLGMGLALWRLQIQERKPRWLEGPLGHSNVWLVGAVLLWMVACYRASWEIAVGFASVLLVGAVVMPLRHGWAIAPFRWRALALLGVISYSTYLWHWPILVAISNRSLTNPNLVIGRGMTQLFVLGFALSVAVGALSYWQVERRGLTRRRPWSVNAVSVSPEAVASAGADSTGTSAGAEGPAAPLPST